MTPERQQIITALKELGCAATPKAIAEKIGKDNKVVANLLATMAAYGFVQKSAEKHGVWVLPDFVEESHSITNESEEDFII